jgi:hypothetical protein
MPKRQTITYSTEIGGRGSSHPYYLATTHDVMGFYCFDEPKAETGTSYTVIDQLARRRQQGNCQDMGEAARVEQLRLRPSLTRMAPLRAVQ